MKKFLFLMCLMSGVLASTTTATMTNTLTSVANCSLSTSGGLAFGNYTMVNSSVATMNVIANCNALTTYTIGASAGNNTISSRQLKSGSFILNYNMYLDSGYSTLFGDGTTGSNINISSNDGSGSTTTIYGIIPSGQVGNIGNFSDSIILKITY